MLHPRKELWLRQSIRVIPAFTSDNGTGAAWDFEIEPSEHPVFQCSCFPESLTILCKAGRGVFDIEDGKSFVLSQNESLRIPANTRHILRNLNRDTWKLWYVMNGETGAESFFDALGMTRDEDELERQADSVSISLHRPAPEPSRPSAIVAAENKIPSPPLGMNFNF